MRRAGPRDPSRRARPAGDSAQRRSISWRSRSSPPAPREDLGEDELFDAGAPRLAVPRPRPRSDFDAVVEMLAEGIATRARPQRRVPASRCGERPRARPPRRAPGRDHLRRRDSRTPRSTRWSPSRKARSSARSTRTSRSRAWPATSSCSAPRPGASAASRRAACAWRTRTARRRRSRSGAAKRRPHRRAVARKSRALREEIAASAEAVDWLDARVRPRPARRRAGRRVRARRRAPRSARCRPRDTRRRRALLRRRRRHAARHPRAVRRAHQPRLGPGAAQALLPVVQLRAAGGRHRQRHRDLARRAAHLSARDRLRVPASRTPSRTC